MMTSGRHSQMRKPVRDLADGPKSKQTPIASHHPHDEPLSPAHPEALRPWAVVQRVVARPAVAK